MPEPPFRPGDTPDFSSLKIPAAGEAPRPDIGVAAAETHPLTTQLVRVLGDEHQAVGPWDPRLDADTLRKMLRDMVTVRVFDDRMYRAQRQGKTSFYMKCTGEEAIAVAAAAALDRDDMHFPTYRQQGLLVARGYPLVEMMNQIYSNNGDKLKGRQLPIMYSDKAHGFFSISGNLGTQFPQAVGWAMGAAIKGDSRIAMGWIGDGATAEGDFHSAMTFAAVYNVARRARGGQQPVGDLELLRHCRRRARDLCAARGRLWHRRAFASTAMTRWRSMPRCNWAAERARSNNGPTLIELFTYRAEGNSTSDDPSTAPHAGSRYRCRVRVTSATPHWTRGRRSLRHLMPPIPSRAPASRCHMRGPPQAQAAMRSKWKILEPRPARGESRATATPALACPDNR